MCREAPEGTALVLLITKLQVEVAPTVAFEREREAYIMVIGLYVIVTFEDDYNKLEGERQAEADTVQVAYDGLVIPSTTRVQLDVNPRRVLKVSAELGS